MGLRIWICLPSPHPQSCSGDNALSDLQDSKLPLLSPDDVADSLCALSNFKVDQPLDLSDLNLYLISLLFISFHHDALISL